MFLDNTDNEGNLPNEDETQAVLSLPGTLRTSRVARRVTNNSARVLKRSLLLYYGLIFYHSAGQESLAEAVTPASGPIRSTRQAGNGARQKSGSSPPRRTSQLARNILRWGPDCNRGGISVHASRSQVDWDALQAPAQSRGSLVSKTVQRLSANLSKNSLLQCARSIEAQLTRQSVVVGPHDETVLSITTSCQAAHDLSTAASFWIMVSLIRLAWKCQRCVYHAPVVHGVL